MKQSELQPCCFCKRGVVHGNRLTFTRATVERMMVKLDAVKRQTGLEMMLGGAAFLAQVMGPNEDIAVPLLAPDEKAFALLICDDCAIERRIAELWEAKPVPMSELKTGTKGNGV